ncbi:hypothetical protein [Sorangium sp. So ce233]|uniref:hypothetical protein n=1 Tax=Sorangium sp. So ce233 TaxID=3133290 RepID=UPI003F5E4691
MRLAAMVLAVLFVPVAITSGLLQAEGAPQTAGLARSLAAALLGGAIALWLFREALGWWMRRRSGGER